MLSPALRADRALVFCVSPTQLPDELSALMPEYRRMVNRAIRMGLAGGTTSREGLLHLAYPTLVAEHKGLSSFAVQAICDATAILHAYRKRQRRQTASRPPYIHRLYLKVAPSSFHFDATTGSIRVFVGGGRWATFALPVATWHRAQFTRAGARPALLIIKPRRVTVVVSRDAPAPLQPEAIIALDTNEDSLDGVHAAGDGSRLVRIPFGGVRAVQARHFVRRRRLGAKKANDLRLKRRLLGREGRRESDRVKSRLHVVSKGLVLAAKERGAAIVLEDLTGFRRAFSRQLNRRLSAWPYRELHRQITYKAHDAGVPVVFVNPYQTSQKCAMCGWTPKKSDARRSAPRPDGMFVCGNTNCPWRVNRQINAGINILQTALTKRPGLGGVQFRLDALSHDVMNPLCERAPRAARGERTEREPPRSVPAATTVKSSVGAPGS